MHPHSVLVAAAALTITCGAFARHEHGPDLSGPWHPLRRSTG